MLYRWAICPLNISNNSIFMTKSGRHQKSVTLFTDAWGDLLFKRCEHKQNECKIGGSITGRYPMHCMWIGLHRRPPYHAVSCLRRQGCMARHHRPARNIVTAWANHRYCPITSSNNNNNNITSSEQNRYCRPTIVPPSGAPLRLPLRMITVIGVTTPRAWRQWQTVAIVIAVMAHVHWTIASIQSIIIRISQWIAVWRTVTAIMVIRVDREGRGRITSHPLWKPWNRGSAWGATSL